MADQRQSAVRRRRRCHKIRKNRISIPDAFAALNGFDFARTGTGLYGPLVEPPSKKDDDTMKPASVCTGREAWESAPDVLAIFYPHAQTIATAPSWPP